MKVASSPTKKLGITCAILAGLHFTKEQPGGRIPQHLKAPLKGRHSTGVFGCSQRPSITCTMGVRLRLFHRCQQTIGLSDETDLARGNSKNQALLKAFLVVVVVFSFVVLESFLIAERKLSDVFINTEDSL